jgi:iron(III) transport system ATP-binding protein
MPGRVRRAIFLGDHAEYTVATALGDLFILDRNAERLTEAGADVHLSFKLSGVAVLPRPS